MTDSSGGGGAGFFASILIIVGILWMTLAGLCSGTVLVSAFMSGEAGRNIEGFLSAVPIVLLVGTAGALPGMLIWLGGRALRNRRNSANR